MFGMNFASWEYKISSRDSVPRLANAPVSIKKRMRQFSKNRMKVTFGDLRVNESRLLSFVRIYQYTYK